jgi:V8-like Glu-specific endopeptidase
MPWRYNSLSNTLAGLYFTQRSITALVIDSGLQPGKYALDGPADDVFTLMIRTLEQQGKIKQLVGTAIRAYPDNPILQDVMNDVQDIHNSVYAGEPPTTAPAMSKEQYEKITGEQATFLPVSFFEMGMLRSSPVARIVTPDGLGTGFLINDQDLLLTNNHVIDETPGNGSYKAQFNYQKSLRDLPLQYDEFEIDNSVFHTSKDDDWTVVKVKNNPSSKYGFIPLVGKEVQKNDFVNIIQHPGGEYKQIGLYHNLVTYCDDRIVQYLTDTMPGSSGSPVFNSQWDLVALHHSGGYNKVAGEGKAVLSNEGIKINRIIMALKSLGIT